MYKNELLLIVEAEPNTANPFAEQSYINYYIPSKYQGIAKLVITDEFGRKVFQEHDVCTGKPCQITISAKGLNTGVYVYWIQLNGRLLVSKKLILIK